MVLERRTDGWDVEVRRGVKGHGTRVPVTDEFSPYLRLRSDYICLRLEVGKDPDTGTHSTKWRGTKSQE